MHVQARVVEASKKGACAPFLTLTPSGVNSSSSGPMWLRRKLGVILPSRFPFYKRHRELFDKIWFHFRELTSIFSPQSHGRRHFQFRCPPILDAFAQRSAWTPVLLPLHVWSADGCLCLQWLEKGSLPNVQKSEQQGLARPEYYGAGWRVGQDQNLLRVDSRPRQCFQKHDDRTAYLPICPFPNTHSQAGSNYVSNCE